MNYGSGRVTVKFVQGLPYVMAAIITGGLPAAPGHAESTTHRDVQITVELGRRRGEVSKYLTGSHFVYAFERDSLYRDPRIADWMRRARVRLIRWPGGTAVQNYHWNKLDGIAFRADEWDPGYRRRSLPGSEYMSLDEFIAWCRRIGAEPMVGLNITSGKKYGREKESLEEAKALITYCREHGYGVRHWYIGNESFKDFSVEEYARYVDRYGELLHRIDPHVEIIADWKFVPESKHRFQECLRLVKASRQIDVLDIHEKWGNDWSMSPGSTWAEWQHQRPIYDGRLAERIREFRRRAAAAGRWDVRLAFNEWGVGRVRGGNPFKYALVAADMLLELIRCGVYQACYWNLNMGPMASRVLCTANDRHTLLKLNPVARVFEMYAGALEKELVEVESSMAGVYGFAVTDPNDGLLQIYLLNKTAETVSAEVSVVGSSRGYEVAWMERFVAPGVIEKSKPVDASGGPHRRVELRVWSFNRIGMRRTP